MNTIELEHDIVEIKRRLYEVESAKIIDLKARIIVLESTVKMLIQVLEKSGHIK